MTMPGYAVTGASGHLGRFAVHQLLARGVLAPNVAVVRTCGEAAGLAAGVQVREADYLRPETLGAALTGVDRLLLVSSSEVRQLVAHHINAIAAAGAPGLSRILPRNRQPAIRWYPACFKGGTDVWSGRGRWRM